MDPFDSPITPEQLENALEGDGKIALVRPRRQTRDGGEERRRSRKSRVSFGGVKAQEYGEANELIEVTEPLRVKDYPPSPILKPEAVAPPRYSIRPPVSSQKNVSDKNIQTDDCDLTECVDSILFQDIDVSQIRVGVARDINEGKPRRPSRPRGDSLVADSGTAPRARSASVARVENPRLARRNTKPPKGTPLLRKASFYLAKALRGGKYLQESDSESGSSSYSSDWTSESSGSEYYSDERDKTWIEPSGTDNEIDEMEMAYDEELANSKQPISNVSPQCAKLVMTTIPFFWLLKVLGRMPFETYVEDEELKFRIRKRGFTFIYFCFTSFVLMFNMAMTAQGLIETALLGKGQVNFYEQITRRLVDKYFYFAIVNFFYFVHATAWNLCVIFDEGAALAEFLTKFTSALDTLKYNPFDTLLRRILLQQGWFIMYAITMSVFCIWDVLAVVRGTSDLIGLLIFFPFDDEVIFSEYHTLIQIYGFLSHLYAVYATHSIVFFAVTYSHLLENIGRIWNLRVAYVFGSLGRPEADNTIVTYHTIIPYEKLFKEHNMIVDFVRETGDAFTVGVGTFYILKFWELVFIGYHAMSVVIFPVAKFNESIVRDGIPPHLPPFIYADSQSAITSTANYLFLQGLGGWYIVSYWLADCGESIQYGYELVRRHCILLCDNPIQKRFVLSLHNTFAPTSDCYLRMTFTMNKQFIFDFFFWIVTALALLTAFSPQQLKQELVTVCNTQGTCVAISLPGSARRSGTSNALLPDIAATLNITAPQIITTSTTLGPVISPGPPIVPTVPIVPPVVPPRPPPKRNFFDCPATWSGRANLTMITLPTACHSNLTEIYPIYTNGILPADNCSIDGADDKIYGGIRVPPLALHSCDPTFSTLVVQDDPDSRDTCGNLRLPIDKTGIVENDFPKKIAVKLTIATEERILCCYDYKIPNSTQLEVCNMESQAVADDYCEAPTGGTSRYLFTNLNMPLQEFFKSGNLPSAQVDEISDCLCGVARPLDAGFSSVVCSTVILPVPG